MFEVMFICIWISVMCHFSSSIGIKFKKKKRKEEEMLFQGKPLSLKNVSPSYRVGPKLRRKELNPSISLEAGAVGLPGSPGGLYGAE